MKYFKLLTICFLISLGINIFSAEIDIEIPKAGFTTQRIHIIKGRVANFSKNRIVAVLNGIPQTVPLSGQRFSFNTVVAPDLNIIEIKAGRFSKNVSFYAKVPRRDVKTLFTWDTPTDVDLWVIDPKGDKCSYGNKRIPSGGNLDVDVIAGFGPEIFTMANALPGSYSVQVQIMAPIISRLPGSIFTWFFTKALPESGVSIFNL